jgi:hypothetical protein
MVMGTRRRRRIDRLVAVGIAVAVIAIGVTVYGHSDIKSAQLATGTLQKVPGPSTTAPSSLTQKWSKATDPTYGAIASPYGVVITADSHTVTAHDWATGAVRWSYRRTDRTLCTIGSGDIDTRTFDPAAGLNTGQANDKVRGVLSVFAENGFCSQINTFDPVTGARSFTRTSPTGLRGQLTFGGPYAAWMDPTLVEIWRYDLYRTAQYGDLPNPTQPFRQHLGCLFTDLAVADTQYATVEHCAAGGPHARIALNFTDPPTVDKKWDVFTLHPRMDLDTGSDAARIVGITADRVAVLVSAPSPAVVLYDAAGTVISRTRVNIPAADIAAADKSGRITPANSDTLSRRSLIGTHLLSISQSTTDTAQPATSIPTTTPASPLPTITTGDRPQVSVQTLTVDWVAAHALGLPAVVGGSLLMPVSGGLSVFAAAAGPTAGDSAAPARTLAVNRNGYTGRVYASAIGTMVIETRGHQVVALR